MTQNIDSALVVRFGMDTSGEERREIELALQELPVAYGADLRRPTPLGELPLFIELTVAVLSGVTYDIIKACVVRILRRVRDERRAKRDLVITVSERGIRIATEGHIIVFDNGTREIEVETVEQVEVAMSALERETHG